MSSNRPDEKPVDAPPSGKPIEPQTPSPQGPPPRTDGDIDSPGKGNPPPPPPGG